MDLDRFYQPATYKNTRVAVEQASTLLPDSYHLPEFYRLETEQVFRQSWVLVGYTCQIDEPGKVLTAAIGDQPIMITRGHDHIVRGFYNVCRHRASVLLEESQKVTRFRCPYHSWTYDLEGKLLSCPLFEQTGAHFNKADYHLLPIRVESWGCFVFACLEQKTEPLSDYLGDLVHDYKNFPLDELVLVRRKEYQIEANWKLIAENFLEYYHLPWVHPELCKVTAIDMHKRNQGAGMYMSFYASPLLKSGSALDADYFPAMPGLNHSEKNSGYFPYVFPNLAMFLLPHHLFVLLTRPNSVDKTAEYGDLLVHPSLLKEANAESKIDEIFKFYDMVNQQDILAVERVQKGIRVKSYPGGRMNYRFEEPVHRFQNMVIDFLTNERQTYPADR